jgi:hypothetical protein
MSGRDPQKRARTADRDATIEVIQAAFVDGQIGPEDRDLRVGNALTAATLGDLDLITRDLQLPEPAVQPPSQPPFVVGPPQAQPPVWVHQFTVETLSCWTVARRRGISPRLGIAVAAMLFASVAASSVVSFVSSLDGSPGPTIGSSSDAFELTETGMAACLAGYEARFGSTRALSATFYGPSSSLQNGYVVIDVPTADGKARHESWMYRAGQFQKTGDARVNATGDGVVDLARLDLRRLMANIEQARHALNVEAPHQVYVIVAQGFSSPQPTVSIHVANEVGESGYLATNLSGTEVLSTYPFGG